MDTNGDGQLDVEEFISGFAAAMRQVTNDPVRTQDRDKIEPAMKSLMMGMEGAPDTDRQGRSLAARGCCLIQ